MLQRRCTFGLVVAATLLGPVVGLGQEAPVYPQPKKSETYVKKTIEVLGVLTAPKITLEQPAGVSEFVVSAEKEGFWLDLSEITGGRELASKLQGRKVLVDGRIKVRTTNHGREVEVIVVSGLRALDGK
jgi:hypothetical protein